MQGLHTHTSKIASEGTPHPRTPSTRFDIIVPKIMPTTAPLSSSTIGPPLDPGVGGGSKNICVNGSYVPGYCMSSPRVRRTIRAVKTYLGFPPRGVSIAHNRAGCPSCPRPANPRCPPFRSRVRGLRIRYAMRTNTRSWMDGIRRER